MLDEDNDIDDFSAGEINIKSRRNVNFALEKERWRFGWEKKLTIFVVIAVAVFYSSLLLFITIGHFRMTVGSGYYFFSTKPHAITDIPVIVALSTIPTVILIALLRYFHYREKKADGDETSLGPSADAIKEIAKAVSEIAKGSNAS